MNPALITLSLLNILGAIPMSWLARRNFARLGRFTLPVAIWTGVALYGHAALTFALAWLDRGSLGDPSSTSSALGSVVAVSGVALIVAGRREYASRARVSRSCRGQADNRRDLPIFA